MSACTTCKLVWLITRDRLAVSNRGSAALGNRKPWTFFSRSLLHGVVESKILVPTSRNHKTYLMPGVLEATAPISLGDDGCFSRLLETCTRKESLSDGSGGMLTTQDSPLLGITVVFITNYQSREI